MNVDMARIVKRPFPDIPPAHEAFVNRRDFGVDQGAGEHHVAAGEKQARRRRQEDFQ
jgi:hypothetical protein